MERKTIRPVKLQRKVETVRRCLGCMEEYKDEYQVCPYCGYEVGTPPREAYHMIPGTLLAGRYTVGQVLGFGGFGVTYIGYDNVLERKVAIKEYLPSEFSTRIPGHTEITTYEGERSEQFHSGLNKFLDEAKMLAKMQETNGVVQIFNSFQENATAYIVMEYLEGKTLKTYLEEKGKLSVDEAKEILHPIITALKDVHAMGIMHRDIAPDNIYLANDGRVKLLDFGASRFATTSHSKSLSVIIKPGFAPVEQYRSRGDQGPWTDVYSLAATLYKMITGITPEDAMERVEKEELKKPSKLGIDVPQNVENAIMNALNIKIEDRTQNVEDFEEELYKADKVKLHFVKLKKADVGKWPLWTKLVVSAAALGVVVFAGLLATGVIDYSYLVPKGMPLPAGMTRVPNVVNEDVPSAEGMTNDAELIFQIVDKQYSDFIPQDMVLAQGLNKGKIVNSNNVLEVVVSGGREVFVMADVCGISKEEAIDILLKMGLDLDIQEEYDAIAKGYIVSQSIGAGVQIHRGDTITIVVSKGYDTYIDTAAEIEIPDFTGMTMEEAKKEAKKYGLYLVKGGVKVGNAAANTVLEQDPKAGTIAHQGDVISLIVAADQGKIYMPDVQYKDEVEAVAEIQNIGLIVETEHEESKTVAKGKVIRQSIEPNTEVSIGQKVTIVISEGSPELMINEWSEWVEALPSGVDKSKYEIESKTQYSSRDKAFMDGYNSSVEGWTLYNTVVEKGEFGDWSEWSTTKPDTKKDREITDKTQYAYSDYEQKTQEDNSAAPGDDWKLLSTVTFPKDDWGEFTDWSTTTAEESDYRHVESKQQYSTRSKQETSKINDSSVPADYIGLSNTSVSYGEWSSWIRGDAPAATATMEVKTGTGTETVKTGTKYKYSRWWCKDTAGINYYSWSESELRAFVTVTKGKTISSQYPPKYEEKNTTTPLNNERDFGGGHYQYTGYWYNETTEDIMSTVSFNQYQTRTVTTTYTFWRWSNWSDWMDGQKTASDSVQIRTVYRYQDRPVHYRYTFERWTPYTAWSDSQAVESATRRVKTQTIYQYRDRKDLNHYYFYKWGEWSKYGDAKIEETDSREVQKRIMYRYRNKN